MITHLIAGTVSAALLLVIPACRSETREARVLLGFREEAAACYRACGPSEWQGSDEDKRPLHLLLPGLWCGGEMSEGSTGTGSDGMSKENEPDDGCAREWGESELEECPEMEAGGDRLKIVVDHGEGELELKSRELPRLDFLVDSVRVEASGTMNTWDTVCGRTVSIAERTVPVNAADTVAARVVYEDELELESSSVTVTDPVVVVTCDEPPPVALVSGLEQLAVTVCGPDTTPSTAEFVDAFSPTAAKIPRTEELPLARSTGGTCPAGKYYGSTLLTAPDRPGSMWTVEARIGSWTGSSDCRPTLAAAAPLTLGVTAATQLTCDTGSGIPRRTGQEQRPECRALNVDIQSLARPSDKAYVLKVDAGELLGGGEEMRISAVSTGEGGAHAGSTTWTLPSTSTPPVEVTAGVSALGFPGRSVKWRLEPVFPVGGQLFNPAQSTIGVGEGGASGVVVRGQLTLEPGTRLVDFQEFSLVVDATAQSDLSEELPCGTPIDPIAIDCDRDDVVPGLIGGCALTPSRPTVKANGEFELLLPTSVCFAGSVDLMLYARTYAVLEAEDMTCSCLGHRKVEGEQVELENSVMLTYVPAHSEEGSSSSDGTGG